MVTGLTSFLTHTTETLSLRLDRNEMTHRGFGIFNRLLDPKVIENDPEAVVELDNILKRVKATGYRTIVLALENPTRELPALAAAANRAGLTNGDYLWVHFGEIEFNHVFDGSDEVNKFLAGSIAALPFEFSPLFIRDPPENLVKGWLEIDEAFVDRIKGSYPKDAPGGEDVASVTVDFYRNNYPEYISGYAYEGKKRF